MNDIVLVPVSTEYFFFKFREMMLEVFQTMKTENVEEKFLTVAEVSEKLNISVGTVSNWSNEGKLVKHFFGRTVRYKNSEVMSASKTLKKYQHSSTA